MRRSPFLATLVATLLLAVPAAAQARPAAPTPEPSDATRAAAVLAEVRTPGTAWGLDPATGRMTLTVDDTVTGDALVALRATAARAGAVLRHEPGRLGTLIAGGQAIYGGNGGRCSLGVNARSGTTWYFVTAGHCANLSTSWYVGSTQTVLIGTRTGSSFPGDDYGVVRYASTFADHPAAIYTYPGLLNVTGAGNAYIGQTVCRSGSTTGVRCGTVLSLNTTVNYAEGSVYGLIRTNICAEPGDSGGPLYVPSTGVVLGILSGGSGNCSSGGTTYYQPIGEVLSRYGLSLR